MNNIKKYLLSLLFIPLLASCDIIETMKLHKIENNVNRAIGNKRIKYVGYYDNIMLYEIDGHSYAFYRYGGVIHLESCKCKKNESAN